MPLEKPAKDVKIDMFKKPSTSFLTPDPLREPHSGEERGRLKQAVYCKLLISNL